MFYSEVLEILVVVVQALLRYCNIQDFALFLVKKGKVKLYSQSLSLSEG